jgi:RNA polymerase sigma-70 factor (ECF subfamily)
MGMEHARRFEALYRDAHGDVLRFVARRTQTVPHAEDVTHEAFLVAWRRIDDLPADSQDARAWLFGVARGCLRNAERSGRRKRALAVRIASQARDATEPSPEGGLVVRADLAKAWATLRPAAQEALALVTWDGLTPSQAALVAGISANTFRVRLARARAALREALNADGSRVADSQTEGTP